MLQRARLPLSESATPSDFRHETSLTGLSSDLRCGTAYLDNRAGARGATDRARAAGWRHCLFAPEPLEIIEHSGDQLLSTGILCGQGAGEKLE